MVGGGGARVEKGVSQLPSKIDSKGKLLDHVLYGNLPSTRIWLFK